MKLSSLGSWVAALLSVTLVGYAAAQDSSIRDSTQAASLDAPLVISPALAEVPKLPPPSTPISVAVPIDIWERIRQGYAIPNLENAAVRDREQWYATRPDYIVRMTERSRKYLHHIVEELERRNMPSELALLPFIESAFNPQAVSSAKAAGMWQFMPSTGKYFELKQNMFRDDRRDVLASTRAALDYLQKLYGMFGDWQLALAAYNWGEGSVQRAIAKNQRAGLPTGYDDLAMPAETRQYIPKLQAIKNIVAAPQHLGVQLPDIANHPYFQQVPITRDIDVTVAAKLANLPVEEFKALNPSANRPVILSSGTPQILLPWDNAATFQNNLDNNPPSRLATWTAWIAPATMAVATAARQVGMNEAEFRAANHIPPGMLVKAGSTLLVPRSATKQTEVTTHVADNAQLSLTPAVILKRTSVAVRKGETVAGLAARYNVNTGKVAEWNAMSVKGVFKKAQQAIIYVAVNALNPSVRIGPTSRPAPVAATPKQAPKQGIKLATKPAAKTTAKEASGSPKRK